MAHQSHTDYSRTMREQTRSGSMLDGTNGNGGGDKFVVADAELENVEASIAAARERAKAVLAEMDQLEASFRRNRARGTGDVTKEAKEAREVRKPTTAEMVEEALRQKPMTLNELVKALDEPAGRINAVLSSAKKTNSIYNLGTAERPRWVWKIGDQTTTERLQAAVMALICDQPLETSELVAATGAKPSRVSGVLVAIARSGVHMLNLGTPYRHRHFVVPKGALDGRLMPKAKNTK